MDSIYRKLRAHLGAWRTWEWNPVLLKELRQAVRSQILTGTLMVLLAALFICSLVVMAEQSISAVAAQQLGRTTFEAFLVILTVASLLFIPLYIGVRLAGERDETNPDMMFITTLGPRRILRGKLICGAYLAVLFFSVCTPFMTFTNLMRGVDLPTIFFILICLYGVVCLAIQAAILIACLPFPRLVKGVLGLMFTGGLLVVSLVLILFFFGMVRVGVGEMMKSIESWIGFFVVQALILAGILMFYGMSVALIGDYNRTGGYFTKSPGKERGRIYD